MVSPVETCMAKMYYDTGFMGYRGVCGRPAKTSHDGQHYCGMHDPAKKAARLKKRMENSAVKKRSQAEIDAAKITWFDTTSQILEDAMKDVARTGMIKTPTIANIEIALVKAHIIKKG